jgi:hypothetical protein
MMRERISITSRVDTVWSSQPGDFHVLDASGHD